MRADTKRSVNYERITPPREYLIKVLKWEKFCKTHKLFKNAIIGILEENEQLKIQLKGKSNSEIVKALECCCEDSGCPAICPLKDMAYVGDCIQVKSRNARDLINRLQAENERLTYYNEILRCANQDVLYTLETEIKTAKAEVVTEFVEKVKQNQRKLFNYIYSPTGFGLFIDGLAEEMAGMLNESKNK